MSNNINDQLLDRAHEMQSYWEGEGWGKAIDYAIEHNDLDTLRLVVVEAEREAALQEDPQTLEDFCNEY